MQGYAQQTSNEQEQGKKSFTLSSTLNEQEFKGRFSPIERQRSSEIRRRKQFSDLKEETKSVDWQIPKQFLEVPQKRSVSCGTEEDQFECKCNTKLNGSVEVNEHFKSCYQMFVVYGSFMKSFMSLKEQATSEPKLQNNLYTLLKQLTAEIEECFSSLVKKESQEMEFEVPSTARNSAFRLPVPRNYIPTSPKVQSANTSSVESESVSVSEFNKQSEADLVNLTAEDVEKKPDIGTQECDVETTPRAQREFGIDFLGSTAQVRASSRKATLASKNIIKENDRVGGDQEKEKVPAVKRVSLRKARSSLNTPDYKNAVREMQGPVTLEKGATYEGEWLDGLKDGFGKQIWPDGSSYEGEWKRGRIDGKGTYKYANGNSYTGEWVKDRKQGQGTFKHETGTEYTGGWFKDKEEGFGKNTWPNGSSYEGEYHKGQKHGKGLLTYQNGDVYDGQLLQNQLHGTGTFTWASSKKKYIGEWQSNKMHGRGHMIYPDGKEYIGDFTNDLRHGQGLYTFGDGREYEGGWEKGKQNGEGSYKDKDSTRRRGIWQSGKRVKWLDGAE